MYHVMYSSSLLPWYAWIWFPLFFIPWDTMFFISALCKVPHGAWMALAAAAIFFCFMLCWYMGRRYEDQASVVGASLLVFLLESLLPPFSSP